MKKTSRGVKRERGLRQNSFPIPHTCAEGVAIAVFGKGAGSEGMQLLLRMVHQWSKPSDSRAENFLMGFIEYALRTLGDIADKRRLLAMKLRVCLLCFDRPFTRRDF